MDDQLKPVMSALAAPPRDALNALHASAENAADTVPGLMAWLEHAAGWELDRRAGTFYPLTEPMRAIDDTEAEASRIVLTTMSAAFARDGREGSPAIAQFLNAARGLIPAPKGTH